MFADPQKILQAVNSMFKASGINAVSHIFAREFCEMIDADLCRVYYGSPAVSDQPAGEYQRNDQPVPVLSRNQYEDLFHQVSVAKEPIVYLEPSEKPFVSGFLLSIKIKNDLMGIIQVLFKTQREIVPEQKALVLLLAEHASLAIEESILLATAHQRARELETIYQTSLAMTSRQDLDSMLDVILKGYLEMDQDATNAYLFFYENDALRFAKGVWAEGKGPYPVSTPRQEGITFIAARSGDMVLVPDIQNHVLYENAPELWTGAVVAVPLKSKDIVIGVINIGYETPKEFTEDNTRLVQLLADQAAVSIDRTRALRAVEQRATQLEVLRQASLTLTASLELEHVFNAILKSSLEFSSNALDSHIFLYEKGQLQFVAALFGDGTMPDKPLKEPREDGLTATVARTGKMIVVEDVTQHAMFPTQETWTDDNQSDSWGGAIVGIPMKIGEQVVGVINIAFSAAYKFLNEELYVLELLADQAAIAIENARLHRLVLQQSVTDTLTQVHNRRAFEKYLNQAIQEAKESVTPFVLMILDLDGFKQINDVFGHAIGDRVLFTFAQKLNNLTKETGFFARLGGDEFAIILPNTEYKEALTMQENWGNDVREIEFENYPQLSISMTAGLAQFPIHGQTSDQLLHVADHHLYQQKSDSDKN